MPKFSVYVRSSFPLFHEKLQLHFPGTLPIKQYYEQTAHYLKQYGFEDDNTLGVIATCRDEITAPLVNEVNKYWGKTFNFSALPASWGEMFVM